MGTTNLHLVCAQVYFCFLCEEEFSVLPLLVKGSSSCHACERSLLIDITLVILVSLSCCALKK